MSAYSSVKDRLLPGGICPVKSPTPSFRAIWCLLRRGPRGGRTKKAGPRGGPPKLHVERRYFFGTFYFFFGILYFVVQEARSIWVRSLERSATWLIQHAA